MAGEIASAFVRIRPNMAGFRSETESGVRSAFGGLAKIAGASFGAFEVGKFGVDAIQGAASLQKQVETIRAEFGQAGKAAIAFGETGAQQLGLSANAADSATARFGILFKNLGIGQVRGAAMAVNLEKLAGSLAAIRGVDPSTVLERLPLVLAGNVRALKSMGLSIDPLSIKLAALKLGLTSTIKDAITPAIKAQAIYALATANLGVFQAQAAKHAGDLANVQRRLSAAWTNAKEQLGTALLPVVTKLANEFLHWFTQLQKTGKLQQDFNAIAAKAKGIVEGVATAVRTGWHIFVTVTGWLGGTKQAVIDLFAVLAIAKLVSIAGGIKTSLVTNGAQLLAREFKVAETEVRGAFTGMELASIGFSTTLKAALISTGIGALAVGIGIAAAEIITHWNTVKQWLIDFGNWIKAHAYVLLGLPIIGQFLFVVVEVIKHFNDLKRGVSIVFTAIKGTINAFVTFFTDVWSHPIGAVETLFRDLRNVVTGVWQGMEQDAIKVALKIVEPFSHLPGFLGGGVFRGIKDSLQKQLADIQFNAQTAANDVGSAFADTGAKVAHGVALSGTDKGKVAQAGKDVGTVLSTNVVAAVNANTPKVTHAVIKSVAEATAAARAEATKKIDAAVGAAKTNLDKIGQELAAQINKILDKLDGVGNKIAGSPQATAFKKLKDLIGAGAGTNEVQRAAQQLASEVQAAASKATQGAGTRDDRRNRIKQQLADLTDQFNKHAISLKTFNKRLADDLRKDGIPSYGAMGKQFGVAFVDQFKAEVKGLQAQAGAIAVLPKNLRIEHAGGGSTDIRIIKPLETIRAQEARIAAIAQRTREQNAKSTERAAKATEKTAAAAAKIATNTAKTAAAVAHTKVGTLPGTASKKGKATTKTGVQP